MSFQQGLSGLNSSSRQLDTIGNNVANASTVGFKQSQAQFADMFAASLSGGGAVQIGTGTKVAAVAQQFTQGNITNTNNTLDIAISGQGFFRMQDQNLAIKYSRNGQFQVDKSGFVVNNQGHNVMGYLPLATGKMDTTTPVPLKISAADLVPKQTSNLAAGGLPVSVGANLDSRVTFATGLTQASVTGAAPAIPITAAAPLTITAANNAMTLTVDGIASGAIVIPAASYATSATLAAAVQTAINADANLVAAGKSVTVTANATTGALTIKSNSAAPGSAVAAITGTGASAIGLAQAHVTGTALAVSVATPVVITAGVNDAMTVTVGGTLSGAITIPAASYTTAAALASAVQTAINKDATLVAAGRSVTVSANAATGALTVTANSGATIAVAGTAATPLGGLDVAVPVAGVAIAAGNVGAGTFLATDPTTYNNSTSLSVYDSLGASHVASLYFQKTSANNWNTYLTIDGVQTPPAGPLSTLTFGPTGTLLTPAAVPPLAFGQVTSAAFTPLDATGKPNGATAQTLTFDFSTTSQYGGAFGVNTLTQDGYASGRLNGFSTGTDGTILARYSNGQSKALGQMMLVNFSNPQGLQPVGNNEWVNSSASGLEIPGTPGQASLGLLQSSAVEDSNVDLTAELVNMITAQRVYQANAQTIKTQDQVLQTLVNLR